MRRAWWTLADVVGPARVVADAAQIGSRYLEDCAVAPVNDTANPFADGVRAYALDADRAAALWERTEALIAAAQAA